MTHQEQQKNDKWWY